MVMQARLRRITVTGIENGRVQKAVLHNDRGQPPIIQGDTSLSDEETKFLSN